MIIATRQNVDGSYDAVGMNNRRIAPNYKQAWRLNKWCREFGRGRIVKLEYFYGCEERPYKVVLIHTTD